MSEQVQGHGDEARCCTGNGLIRKSPAVQLTFLVCELPFLEVSFLWELRLTSSGLIQLKCELPTFEQFKWHLLQAGTSDSVRGKGSALFPLIIVKTVASTSVVALAPTCLWSPRTQTAHIPVAPWHTARYTAVPLLGIKSRRQTQ